jgi:hypothetical protein
LFEIAKHMWESVLSSAAPMVWVHAKGPENGEKHEGAVVARVWLTPCVCTCHFSNLT